MKYEMIFGDESLFHKAKENDVLAIKCNSTILFFTCDDEYQPCDVLLGSSQFSVAMRRIIQEPKRWTVEDHKAGRLPEVGAEYNVDGCIVEHLGNGSVYQNIFYFKYPSGACGNAHEQLVKPLETLEEKAERLRCEWVKLVRDKALISADEYTTETIYDALLSGTLSVPTKGGE